MTTDFVCATENEIETTVCVCRYIERAHRYIGRVATWRERVTAGSATLRGRC